MPMHSVRDRTTTALIIMLDVAFHSPAGQPVSTMDIAARTGLPRRGIEPTLQALARSGLLKGVRGPHGGYRLGHPAREILLADIYRVTAHDDTPTERRRGTLFNTVVRPFMDQMDGILTREYSKVTLHDFVRQAETRGLQRPPAGPPGCSI
ncbi:transcriptional regulator BadM/Rrf78 [Komagataeibacter intermedius TF2]|uniref:Rrf2 family transcriptional regulator n=3 Tax=Komagataeibacter intermedius TaxID=66229 RepID=A0A0N1F860_9PROT|nr:Rrf2 family transcriptional regulator [Komagataeibacter intermedius AF2]GAN86087.1 transcriptional regulator BadM/Rrf78 [Komagataeibacter intermedius TF2]GBQ69243.1 Rrf2 family transcriptional regulator [Komagataeibacter intermedius NRIC 0521]